ncbi:MAG: [protein-PII] uridylyltransferase [Deltaproteobacteria bacterium]|nr:[protein-PII] uridylyltransferase [Deltaproteobacteria bacterium]MBW2075767.1 [protein-PII] uridylyltransferase [Deltaproteobacteria bacterium]
MSLLKSPVSALQENKEKLIACFLRGGEPCFLERHAEILDDCFRESFAGSSVGPGMRMDKNPYAIIALGGYGRKEQYIHSDVDVLLLFKKRIPDEAKGLIQEIFYPLWDIGLDVGYATRSLRECLSLACRDFEVLTSLIDARFVCGISSLYSDLMEQLHGKVLRRHGRAYIDWLSERNQDRHARFGDSTYLLEPNLKEGLGGLRDYHAMLWVARATYDIREPRDLEFLGHLSHSEFQSLSEALSFIRTVRNWLHHLSGRKCDQLYFEYQVKLARVLGFKQKNGQQAVEGFLGALHGQMEFLKRQHLMFLGKAVRAKGRSGSRKATRRTVTPGIELVHDALGFESPEAILRKPQLLIKIFEQSAILGQPLSVEASRLVKEFLYLVDEKFQRSRRVIKSFQRVLVAQPHTFNVLNEMLNTGMMVALIPEMKGLVNRIQYDEYHVYPVDKHLLRTVQILKELGDARPDTQDAFYGKLFKEIRNPELLLWAGLLHDVGKSRDGHGHASQGAKIVRHVFTRMGFPGQDIETISFLVQEHLFLMHTAIRRDINDEKIVVQCARKFRDIEHLYMLYLLTVADSRATGPKAWNDWMAVLLKELFFKVYHILERGELATPTATDVVERKKKDVFQRAVSLPRKTLEVLFDQMSPRYLLYTPSQDILRHIELYQRLGQEPFLLEAQASPGTNYRTATICARDFPGLFSKIAGVFTLNNLDILGAQIYTWRNHIALDIFKVKAPPDTLLENEIWARVKNDLRSALKGELALEPALGEKVRAYRSLQKKILRRPDKVVVDNETSNFFTIIEIYTHDFPGLLYKITDTLFRCKLDIWVAKIATKVDQVVDVFYVRDFDGQKVDSSKEIAAIKEAIKETLANGSKEAKVHQ